MRIDTRKNMDPYAICKDVSQKEGRNLTFCIYLISKQL